ncbi:thioesterase family protein [Paenarthrobacter sp. S56]|uniref:acyl-CoA thioesterase n=1 Tax=Paenarthrobacter sp. S56 TaxID=3138179 RepID=UPI00321A0D40
MQGWPEAGIERTVEWVDTDASGHQHNSAILRWVEAAEAELFRALDLPDYFPSAPRVQQVINYKAKLWFGQRITATVKVQRLGRTSLTLAFEVLGHPLAASNGTPDGVSPDGASPAAAVVAAYGTVTTAHVPAGSLSAQPWPEHFVRVISGTGAEEHPVSS